MNEKEFLKNYDIHDFDVPLCTVDMSIFSLIDGELNVLLVHRDEHPSKGKWALPGGFIDLKKDKSTEAAAHRKLKEKTGLASGYLEQVETIGSPKRDPRGWSLTVLYYALVDISRVKLDDSDKPTQWWPLSKIKKEKLAFDHNALIDITMTRLHAKATYTALPIELMPKEFTLTELQTVFEMILGRSLQAKAFRNRVLTAGMVEETGNSKIAGKRPAKLFRSTKADRDTYFARPLQE
ncbi:NUDIX domain-containing protein [Arenicella sp. 4NH20-0111]|uniref:NUDIX hydrolase n=1 Tax=Arenicella sp. 4NH20-0111 TaxID=3127648 RepID=UPI0031037002